MTPSIVPFLRSVKGCALLAALFGRSLTGVPAWADPDDGYRLKMAVSRSQAVADPPGLVTACEGRTGAIMLLAPGTVVVDLDRKNGADAVAWFERRWGRMPDVPRVSTPTGGVHLWFAAPTDLHFPNVAGKLAPGCDVVGTRGNIPLPGSWSERGAYRLTNEWADVPLPEALAEALSAPPPPPPQKPAARSSKTSRWGKAALFGLAQDVRDSRGYVEQALNRAAFKAGQRSAEIAASDVAVLVDAAVSQGIRAPVAERIATRAFAAGECYPRPKGGRP